jgi:uncharacterized membrane protein (DUF106 family)
MDTIAIELVLIALAYVMVSIVIQRKFSNIKRIREIKMEMNEHQAHLRKEGKTMSKEELDAKTKKMLELQTEMIRHTFKASLIIMPISLILIYYLIPLAFPGTATIDVFSFNLSYRTFVVLMAFIFSLISQMALTQYDNAAARKAENTKAMPTSTEPQNNV